MSEYISKMEQQFRKVKADNPDCILGFKLGEFYEFFYLDARIVASELDLVLTGRWDGVNRIPQCGYPVAAEEAYRTRLENKGYKIAYITE